MVTNQDYNSQTLTAWCMKLKLKQFMTILVRINKYLILVIILSKSKYCSDSNALVVGKMKDEMHGIAIEEFAEIKPKIYLIVVNNFRAYKKAKGVNKNVVVKISPN